MNETDQLYDRIQELNHELAETSKELMGLQRELERQRTINKTIAHDIQKGLEIILAKYKEAVDEAHEVIEHLEYVEIEEDEWDWRYPNCPSCGYKKPDGHWKDCEVAAWLEKYPKENDIMLL